MIRITIASNALHLEAARRLAARCGAATSRRELLVHEPGRFRLTAEDRRRWPLRSPAGSLVMAVLALLAQCGLVEELRLPHLRGAGRALRRLAARAGRLILLDDGLDQYRERPKAVDPEAFPEGTPYWLFSDCPEARAAWCARFDCRDLGPLYQPQAMASSRPAAQPWGDGPQPGSLIVDAPGLERMAECSALPPRPWLVAAHPVVAKRAWRQPSTPSDLALCQPPEPVIAAFRGVVLVGESMTLVAALRLRPAGLPLWVSLPSDADPNLKRLVRRYASRDAAIRIL